MSQAVISPCGQYRYLLSRHVDALGDKIIAYFGVNPSTADHQIDDATVTQWFNYARLNGGSSFIVGNVFAYRSVDVSILKDIDDPVGPDNMKHINKIIKKADILVPCWGSRNKLPKVLHHHLDKLLDLLKASGKPVFVIGLTQSGDPRHPLMTSPAPFKEL